MATTHTNAADFFVGFKATPATWLGAYLGSYGTYGTTNAVTFAMDTTADPKILAYQWYAGGFRKWLAASSSGFSATSQHTIIWRYAGGTATAAWADYVPVPLVVSDTGTFAPIAALDANLKVGGVSATQSLNGAMCDACQSATFAGVRKCLEAL